MSADLEQIKSRIDIVDLISDYVALKRGGQNFKGLCPFHAEKTPSFMVNPARQIFHCFGCGAGGDIFGFVMKHEGVGFRDALEMLAKRAGVELKGQGGGERGLRRELLEMQGAAVEFFRKSLAGSREAIRFMAERGLDEASQAGFRLGYAPAGWHALHRHLAGRGFGEQAVLRSGLAAKGPKGLYDIFRERIMFPICDMQGEAIAFGGRALGEGGPKYLNSPDTPVFKKGETLYALSAAKDEIRRTGRALIVEGYMDAIMCHQHGIKNAVAPLGTALTAAHLGRLGRLAGEVLLVFDGDQAGAAAAKRSLPAVFEQAMRARIILLPEGEDPDSLLRGRGAEAMMGLIESSLSPVEFMLRAGGGPGGRRAVDEAIEAASRASDPISRDELVLEISDRTRISEQSIREKLATLQRTGGHAPQRRTGRGPYDEETLLLSVAAALPGKASEILGNVSPDDIRNPAVRGILARLARLAPGADPSAAASGEEEAALLRKVYIEPGFDPEEADRVVSDCIRRIEKRRVDEEITSAEMAGDLKLLSSLLARRKRLAQGAL